jgi:hypothetical protein
LLLLTLSSIASAHAGHSEDPVHYTAGIDWWIAGILIGVTVGLIAFAWIRLSRKRRRV